MKGINKVITSSELDQRQSMNQFCDFTPKLELGKEKTLFENQLLGYKEAAQYLSISESYIRRLKSKGKIPFVSVSLRGVRFRVASLNAWVAEREVK